MHLRFLLNFRFNRGALLNAGFIESSEIEKDNRIILSSHYPDGDKHFFRSSDYVALHDVDLLPLDPNIRYTWPGREGPYHPIPAPFHPRYYWYAKYFGGVLIITREQFARVNGMSNSFWGWGAEDDEFRGRVIRARYVVRGDCFLSFRRVVFVHIIPEFSKVGENRRFVSISAVTLCKRTSRCGSFRHSTDCSH